MTADTGRRTGYTGAQPFSEGNEHLPDTRERRLTGRFSRGIEHYVERPR